MTPEPLLTAAQLAKWLGVSADTILDWHQDGKVPSITIPGSRAIRFDAGEIRAWLRNGRQRPQEPVSAPPMPAPVRTDGARLVDEQTTWFYGSSPEGLTA